MFVDELLSAVEPFLNAAQETLPQVPESTSLNVEGFNHLPAMEVENRVIVPTNTHLRDIVRTGTMSFSVAPTAEESGQGPFFTQRENLGGQSEAAGPSFMLGQGKADGPLPGEASSAFSVDVSQDEIWDTVEAEEQKQWKALISSREYMEVERHFALCERKISAIVEKVTSFFKEGSLPLNIDEEGDIRRGVEIYFSDLHLFHSNHQRLGHINRALEAVGNPKSRIWNQIKDQIESLR
ncbi:unnamed protein product [Coffea canephora]|uniref:DH200=94 genomic scaffold, scaffold_159 n=1 Tax=Coffea canephora TaxID=49390 RepID=A0A068VCJ7_COFCA|nr:unnamed protein product [Coffea canephora]